MPAEQTRAVLERELGAPLEQVFEWIDLEKPLGSASISQARLSSSHGLMQLAARLGTVAG